MLYLCVRDSVIPETSRHPNPSSCLLSLFLTTNRSVFYFHPLGLKVPVFPFWERPWFCILKFYNVSFDDHPPLARDHVVSDLTAKTDHDATSNQFLSIGQFNPGGLAHPLMTGCTRYRTPLSTLYPLVAYLPVHWNPADCVLC